MKQISASKQRRIEDMITYLVFLLFLLFFGLPLLWVLSLSIRTAAEVNEISLWMISDNPTI